MSEKQIDRLEATHLPVTIAGIDFHNPFCVGSGPTVKTVDMIRKIDEAGWGAAFMKLTIDPEPYMTREPRYRWWKHHKLHTFTLEKRIKLDQALRICEESKKFTRTTKLFSNMTYDGEKGLEGWVRMAQAFENAGADGNELNMCCPNMSFNVELSGDEIDKCTGASMGRNPRMVAEVVRAVKSGSKIPLFVKITSEGGNIAQVAKAAYEAGADVVASVGDRLGMPPIPDIENPLQSPIRLQKDQSITDLTGPWLKPLALRDVYEIRKLNGPEKALCGYGGMTNWKDYVEMMLVGADLVGVCTDTMIRGYDFLHKEILKFKDYMARHNYKHPREMRDLIVNNIKPAQAVEIQEAVAFVEEDKCIGCELCLPIGHCYAIEMIKGRGWKEKNKKGMVAKVDPYQCTGCSTCFDLCPTDCFVWKAVPGDRIHTPI